MLSEQRNSPIARSILTNPELVRPNHYRDHLRDGPALWLDRGECIDPEFTELAADILHEAPAHTLFAYPTPGPLYRRLARYLEVSEDRLCITSGTDGAIGIVFQCFTEAGDLALTTDPTYQMYDVYARMNGVRLSTVPYRMENGYPVISGDEIAAAIRDKKPKIVGLPYPDNPTGYALEVSEVRAVIEASQDVGALILIDEAYYPFHPSTCIRWVDEFNHLVVTRSFSKGWGLAGLRLGWTLAHPRVTNVLHKVRPMVESNGLSMFLAERILDHEDARDASVARLIAGRRYLAEEIAKLGYFTVDTACNFIHVDFGDKRNAVAEVLSDVARYRIFGDSILAHFCRFTTTTQPLAQQLIVSLETLADHPKGNYG